MLRTFGKTVGSALAVLCLVSTLAVAADEKEKGMEMTCTKTAGSSGSQSNNCVVGTMPDGKELVLVGSGLKEGEKMLCHHRDYAIHCVPVPPKK